MSTTSYWFSPAPSKGSQWEQLAQKWLQEGAKGPPPFIEVRQLVFEGTYDAFQWDRVMRRQHDFDASLFGVLLPIEAWQRVPNIQMRGLLETAPSFSPPPMRTIREFLDEYPNAANGPAHIVLDDGNVEDDHIDYAMRIIEAILAKREGREYSLGSEDRRFLSEMNWYEGKGGDETSELRATLVYLMEFKDFLRRNGRIYTQLCMNE